MDSICVVGASLAGIRAIQTLRRDGFVGKIVLVGDEIHKPYDRPPLSKECLSGEGVIEPAHLVKPEDYDALELEERLGWRAKSLNLGSTSAGNVSVEIEKNGETETISTHSALIATGARARNIFDKNPSQNLPHNLSGVHTLRTIDDCQALKGEFLKSSKRVVVIGAGFIGCEVAAAAKSLGLEVSMIEMESQPLERVLGSEMGEFMAGIHRENGIDLRLNSAVNNLLGDERVEGVELGDGTFLEADVVVVGVGAIANTEWLENSGLTIDNGVVCDETCLAAPYIAAAGDVARWKNPRFDTLMRIEHWDNAIEQGKVAARRLLAGDDGKTEIYAPIPWFWSDQYEYKIQLSGLCSPTDEFEILDGSMEDKKFVARYKREGKTVGVLGLNSPRQVMQNRQLIENDFPI